MAFTLNEYDKYYAELQKGYEIQEIDPVNNERMFEVVKTKPYTPTEEEIRQMRIQYRRNNIDDQTAERSRKMANGTWTEEDEQEYLALDAEVTAYIEEHFPYPAE